MTVLFFFGLIHPFDFAQGDEPKKIKEKTCFRPQAPPHPRVFSGPARSASHLLVMRLVFVSLCIHHRSLITDHRSLISGSPHFYILYSVFYILRFYPLRQSRAQLSITITPVPGPRSPSPDCYSWSLVHFTVLFFFGLIHPFDFAQGDEPKNQGKNMLLRAGPAHARVFSGPARSTSHWLVK